MHHGRKLGNGYGPNPMNGFQIRYGRKGAVHLAVIDNPVRQSWPNVGQGPQFIHRSPIDINRKPRTDHLSRLARCLRTRRSLADPTQAG